MKHVFGVLQRGVGGGERRALVRLHSATEFTAVVAAAAATAATAAAHPCTCNQRLYRHRGW